MGGAKDKTNKEDNSRAGDWVVFELVMAGAQPSAQLIDFMKVTFIPSTLFAFSCLMIKKRLAPAGWWFVNVFVLN